MIIELSDEALEYGRQAQRALEAAGGDELVQRAEHDPDRRGEIADSVLADLGAWDLAPRDSPDDLEAAAALCRAAGWWGIAHPVAERLSRPSGMDVDGLLVVDERSPSGAVGGLGLRWAAVSMSGRRSAVTPAPLSTPPKRSAFVTGLALAPVDGLGRDDLPLALVLPCWTLLGMLDRALDLTERHVREREQFGQPLASFQGVQFQLTDAEVERAGVEELAKYALWSAGAGRDDATADALALRLAALEAAEAAFRVAHQLHGAIGFCDEATVSWLSRYSQPIRRLPFGASATRDELTRLLGRRGLTGLFSETCT
jgi:3-oxo-4-pregnene-20-carboxyl-CoA dehydrogenase alpha subunit